MAVGPERFVRPNPFLISQVGLSNDQWMNEVSSWFAISLAKVQEIPIRWAIGPSYVPAGSKLKRASLHEDIQLCKSQIILSSEEQRLSLFLG